MNLMQLEALRASAEELKTATETVVRQIAALNEIREDRHARNAALAVETPCDLGKERGKLSELETLLLVALDRMLHAELKGIRPSGEDLHLARRVSLRAHKTLLGESVFIQPGEIENGNAS